MPTTIRCLLSRSNQDKQSHQLHDQGDTLKGTGNKDIILYPETFNNKRFKLSKYRGKLASKLKTISLPSSVIKPIPEIIYPILCQKLKPTNTSHLL